MKYIMIYVRATVLILALLNQGLASLLGIHPLPFDNSKVENMVTFIFTVIAAGWGFISHNPIGKKIKTKLFKLIHKENDKNGSNSN